MTDWKADIDPLIQETMALMKTIHVEEPMPRNTADQDVVPTALNEAALIVGDYREAGIHRDPTATVYVKVLDDPKLAAAIKGMENGYWLNVVKLSA
jgi:hypothetical protein